MICPKCSYNQKYSDGMYCSKCHRNFIFNPKVNDYNDYKFKLLEERVSHKSTLFYTENQLYIGYLHSIKFRLRENIGLVIFFIFLVIVLIAVKAYLFLIFLLFIIPSSKLFGKENMSGDEFRRRVSTWNRQEALHNLIQEPGMHDAPASFPEDDLYDYGVEAVLIVDQDIYVDLFVRNKCHIEAKVVVISQNGYPNYLVKKVQRILDENEQAKIYYIHDTTTDFAAMQQAVRSFLTVPSTAEENDLGLFQEDIKNISFLRGLKLDKEFCVDYLPPSKLGPCLTSSITTGTLLLTSLINIETETSVSSDFG